MPSLVVLIALNKPFGVICKFRPEPGRRTLADYITIPNVYPAGRLDTDSEGLLLLTDDGALQARISSPRHKLAKVYWAQVEGVPTEAALAALRERRRPRRLHDATRRRAAHRRAREPLAARSADPLPREDPDGVARAHAARRQEPPSAPHDGARRLPDVALGARAHRARGFGRLGARRVARDRCRRAVGRRRRLARDRKGLAEIGAGLAVRRYHVHMTRGRPISARGVCS